MTLDISMRLNIGGSWLLCYYGGIAYQPYNSCKNTWDTVPYFGLTDLLMILCLWAPTFPISENVSNTRPCSKLGGTTLNGDEYYISQTLWLVAIWSKKGRFFLGVSQHFCNQSLLYLHKDKTLKYYCFAPKQFYFEYNAHTCIKINKKIITL